MLTAQGRVATAEAGNSRKNETDTWVLPGEAICSVSGSIITCSAAQQLLVALAAAVVLLQLLLAWALRVCLVQQQVPQPTPASRYSCE